MRLSVHLCCFLSRFYVDIKKLFMLTFVQINGVSLSIMVVLEILEYPGFKNAFDMSKFMT